MLVTVGGTARSGHLYDDRTGISYEYPSGRYEQWIQPGESFVYQKPGIGYIATGTIGDIRPSPVVGRLICDVLNVVEFPVAVPLRDAAGAYFEADRTFWKDKIYWGQGVRPLSQARLASILDAANAAGGASSVEGQYASSSTAVAVDRIAMQVAMQIVRERFPSHVVKQMPHNNPGYDILVGCHSEPVHFVEVKGTQAAEPIFFLSEGERRFSITNSDRYSLLAITGIDILAETYAACHLRAGAISESSAQLSPTQWRGRLI